jgi:hypothetical protein
VWVSSPQTFQTADTNENMRNINPRRSNRDLTIQECAAALLFKISAANVFGDFLSIRGAGAKNERLVIPQNGTVNCCSWQQRLGAADPMGTPVAPP